MKQLIGQVTLEYDQTGQQISSLFVPAQISGVDKDLAKELMNVSGADSEKAIEHNVSLALATFFNQMNKVELRNPETTQIEIECEECVKHDNGIVKYCVMNVLLKSDGNQ